MPPVSPLCGPPHLSTFCASFWGWPKQVGGLGCWGWPKQMGGLGAGGWPKQVGSGAGGGLVDMGGGEGVQGQGTEWAGARRAGGAGEEEGW